MGISLEKVFSTEAKFLLVVFIICEALGIFLDFYNVLLEYDTFMHFVGGSLVSALLIPFFIEHLKKFSYYVNVIATVGVGALWEIAEFLMDQIFGFTTQPSLADTMIDLIVVLSAAIIINFIYKKRHKIT